MKWKLNMQMSESMILAVFLTLSGGFQDAYSYNCRDEVFANAQTGNIVLLGQNLAQRNWAEVFHYVIPLTAFLLGVYLTEWIQGKYKNFRQIHWRQIVVLVEIVLLVAVGFMPQELNVPANAMLSFACAMQVNSFRKFQGLSCATTMCIGNMRNATAALCQYGMTKDKELRKKSGSYFMIIFIFAIGAVVGALSSGVFHERAIWLAAAFLTVGFFLMFIKKEE